eukprot:TRINITY_DN32383_c0_g1_i1.p1 TRINITY_DN32383_c0_g1~~TRINITY_DN32383_c0_g1_i1.p1  ORF type:complete len:750 (+),score=219.30 TRINITY_DN32383_c0_g1_i1:182-2431(+)
MRAGHAATVLARRHLLLGRHASLRQIRRDADSAAEDMRRFAAFEEKQRRHEMAQAKQAAEALESGKPLPPKIGDHIPEVPRDPVAASKTVLGRVLDGEDIGPAGLPLREQYELAQNLHPGTPVLPSPTGKIIGSQSGSPFEELLGKAPDSGKTELQKWNEKHADARRDHERKAHQERLSRVPQVQELQKQLGRQPIDSVTPEDKSAIVAPSGRIRSYMEVIPPSELPPRPTTGDIKRTRLPTDAEMDMGTRAVETREEELARAYDSAYDKWKTMKAAQLAANTLKGKSGIPDIKEGTNLDVVKRAERMVQMERERAGETDPLAELADEVFPENRQEQDDKEEEMERKKQEARINLKTIPNELTQSIRQSIQLKGPIPLAEYMQEALYNPALGYYTSKKEVFGRDGDFITSPEVSIMFGECIGAWALDTYNKLGRPSKFYLVEIGGGKGVLMSRLLLCTTSDPEFHKAAHVRMVDVSPALRAEQRAAIARDCGEEMAEKVEFVPEFAALNMAAEPAPAIVFSNELLDAFPVCKFEYRRGSWHEWLVDLDPDPKVPQHFRFVLSRGETPNCALMIPHAVRRKVVDEKLRNFTIELQMSAYTFLERALEQISRSGGAFLTIDYGADDYVNDSLRGIRGHSFSHPLAAPGEVDLSAFVSFRLLRETVLRNDRLSKRIFCSGVMSQAEFLRKTGIESRAAAHLSRCDTGRDVARLRLEYNTLLDTTDRTGMGRQFKAMCFTSRDPAAMVPPCPW